MSRLNGTVRESAALISEEIRAWLGKKSVTSTHLGTTLTHVSVEEQRAPQMSLASLKVINSIPGIRRKPAMSQLQGPLCGHATLQGARAIHAKKSITIMHDCVSIVAAGHSPFGRLDGSTLEDLIVQVAHQALRLTDVRPGDRLPANLSGGLKAKGHPVGATKISMHALTFRQLTGEPIGLTAANPEFGLVFNMGGMAVANYASVLQARRS